MIEYVMVAAAGLAIGGLVVFLLMRGNASQQSDASVKKQLAEYQQQVESHFAQTADLIDGLTESYRKVFEHLNDSARSLLSDEQINAQIENRRQRSVTLTYLQKPESAEPPSNKSPGKD